MKRIRSAFSISAARLILLASLVLFGPRSSADAAVFERDWKVPGDGLLTYDDVNQREWLDLSVSTLDQFPGTNRDQKFQFAVGEIAPNGLFEGFTFAKSDDVIEFAQSAGIVTTTDDFMTNELQTRRMIDLLGVTIQTLESVNSLGFIDEMEFAPFSPPLGVQFYVNPTRGRAGVEVPAISDFLTRGPAPGLMLFRVIPEPSSLILGLFANIIAIAFRRRARGS